MAQLPPGIRFIISFSRDQWYRAFIFILTFLLYASFHLSRKPISIVKGELHSYCTASNDGKVGFSSQSQKARDALAHQLPDNGTDCGWAPFDQDNYQQLLGALDYSFLCAYAIGMYLSGIIGERLPIRCYLTFGMLASGAFTALFGVGYFYNIHSFGFYVITQIINGLVQTTGWPSVVTCLGNWFGKGRRGLIMGVWNSHTSVGNILGSLIAGYWVSTCWGLSFIVPGAIVAAMGILCFLFLIEHPKDIACSSSPASLRHMEEHPCAEGVPALVCVTWAEAESFPLLSPPDSSRSPWGASFSRSHGESGLPFLFPTLKGIRSEGETGLISGDVSSDSTTVSKFSFPQEFCSLPVGPWRDMVEGKGGLPEGPQRPGAEAELGCFPIGSVPSHMPLIMSRALCKAASARPFTGADFWAQPRPGNFPSKGLLFSMQFLFFQFFKVFVIEILKHVRK